MRATDWFGVAVRVLGVRFLMLSFQSLVSGVGLTRGWWRGGYDVVEGRYYYCIAVVEFLSGLVLLTQARYFVGLAYGEPSIDEKDDRATDDEERAAGETRP